MLSFPTHLDGDDDAMDLGDVTIRPTAPSDEEGLRKLAALEGRDRGETPHLVAEQEGEVIASLSLADGTALGDPFRLTADVVDLLRAHAERRGAAAPVRRGLRVRLRAAAAGGTASAILLAGSALAADATVGISGAPVKIAPATKGFAIRVTCQAADADCEGVLDVRTAGAIKPYASQPPAVAKVGTFPFRIPAGTSALVRGRVYGPALAQALLRGRVLLSITPRGLTGPLGVPRTIVFTHRRA